MSGRFVQPDRGRLSQPGFELKRMVAEITANHFEGRQNLSTDTSLPRLWFHKYPFNFGDSWSELPYRSATDRSPVLTRNYEGRTSAAEIKGEKFGSIDVAVESMQLGPRMIAQEQTFLAARIRAGNHDQFVIRHACSPARMIHVLAMSEYTNAAVQLFLSPSNPPSFLQTRGNASFGAPIENDFPRVPGLHQLESIMKVAGGEAVGDDRRDIESALN